MRNRFKDNLDKIEVFITGMAAGFDLWAADEAIELGIPVIAARPWAGHKPRKDDSELYQKVLDAAIEVVDVDPSEKYRGPWVYQKRNEWMVDNSTHCMSYWSGKEEGGTFNCRECAKNKEGVFVTNIWNDPPF